MSSFHCLIQFSLRCHPPFQKAPRGDVTIWGVILEAWKTGADLGKVLLAASHLVEAAASNALKLFESFQKRHQT